MTRLRCNHSGVFFGTVFCLLVIGYTPSVAQTSSKSRLEVRVKKLEEIIAKLSEKQRELEGRIGVLEQLNLTPAPEKLRQSYITANKDGLTSQVVNIGSHAYQYRLRPTTMGGGGNSYEGFKIPQLMRSAAYGTFEATTFRDSVVIVGKSTQKLGTVQTTVDSVGRTGHWIFTGDLE